MKKLVEFLSVEDGKDKGASGFKVKFEILYSGLGKIRSANSESLLKMTPKFP